MLNVSVLLGEEFAAAAAFLTERRFSEMKKVTVLYMEGCPYCRNAARAMDELEKAYSAYEEVPVEWIEETREKEKAQPFSESYYYVPSMFVDGKKLYEAKPGESYAECKAHVEEVLRAALG